MLNSRPSPPPRTATHGCKAERVDGNRRCQSPTASASPPSCGWEREVIKGEGSGRALDVDIQPGEFLGFSLLAQSCCPMLPSRIPKPAEPRQLRRLLMGPSTPQPTRAQGLSAGTPSLTLSGLPSQRHSNCKPDTPPLPKQCAPAGTRHRGSHFRLPPAVTEQRSDREQPRGKKDCEERQQTALR